MPAGDRKYESTLQFVFGLVIVMILTQCLIKCIITLWAYLSR